MTHQQEIYRAQFERIVTFGNIHPDVFAAPGAAKNAEPAVGDALLSELTTIHAGLGASGVAQETRAAKRATQEKDDLSELILVQLRRIKASVGFIAERRKTPALLTEFQLGKVTSKRDLARAAESFCQALEKLKLEPELLKMKHAPGFVKALRSKLAELEKIGESRRETTQTRVGATARVETLIAQGRVAVKGLHAIALQALVEDPERLKIWQSAFRLPRPAQGKRANPAAPLLQTVPAVQRAEPAPGVIIPIEPLASQG